MITKFAYLNSKEGNKNQGSFQEFKADDNSFIRIGPETKPDKDFRWVIYIYFFYLYFGLLLYYLISLLNVDYIISFSFCQLSIWGAALKPSSKDVNCKFILDGLTGSLLGTTSNLTSTLTGTLDGTLGGLGLLGGNNKKNTNVVANQPNQGGLLGLGIGSRPTNNRKPGNSGGGLLGVF